MKSEKTFKIRKRRDILSVVNEKRKRYHNGEYAKRCTKPDEEVRSLISMTRNEGKSAKLSVMSG